MLVFHHYIPGDVSYHDRKGSCTYEYADGRLVSRLYLQYCAANESACGSSCWRRVVLEFPASVLSLEDRDTVTSVGSFYILRKGIQNPK